MGAIPDNPGRERNTITFKLNRKQEENWRDVRDAERWKWDPKKRTEYVNEGGKQNKEK